MVNRDAYPFWRKTTSVPVDAETLRRAEALILSCEACAPDVAEVAFEYVLDSITGCDPESTDYILSEPVQCPNCGNPIQAGHWRWQETEQGRTVFIRPGTLVTLKKDFSC